MISLPDGTRSISNPSIIVCVSIDTPACGDFVTVYPVVFTAVDVGEEQGVTFCALTCGLFGAISITQAATQPESPLSLSDSVPVLPPQTVSSSMILVSPPTQTNCNLPSICCYCNIFPTRGLITTTSAVGLSLYLHFSRREDRLLIPILILQLLCKTSSPLGCLKPKPAISSRITPRKNVILKVQSTKGIMLAHLPEKMDSYTVQHSKSNRQSWGDPTWKGQWLESVCVCGGIGTLLLFNNYLNYLLPGLQFLISHISRWISHSLIRYAESRMITWLATYTVYKIYWS